MMMMMAMMRGRRGVSRPDKGWAGLRAWFRVTSHWQPQLLFGAEDNHGLPRDTQKERESLVPGLTWGPAEWSLYVLGNPVALLAR